jgi:hypothetical protein
MRSTTLGLLLLIGSASAVGAQQSEVRIQGPAASLLFGAKPDAGAAPDTVATSVGRSHWEKGMWIGSAIGFAGLGGFTYALCEGLNETDDSCLWPALAGAGIGALGGGIIGALIGSAVPRRDTLPPADSTNTSP